MTFAEAMETIKGSSTRNAAKRPSWKGYVRIANYVAEDTTANPEVPESYKVVFVTGGAATADATAANPVTVVTGTGDTAGLNDDTGVYVFAYTQGSSYSGGAWTGGDWTVPGDATTNAGKQLAIDKELWKAMLADDWQTDLAENYETARVGGGGRW